MDSSIKAAFINGRFAVIAVVITGFFSLATAFWQNYNQIFDSKIPDTEIVYSVEVREEGTNNPIYQASITLRLGEVLLPVKYTDTQGLVRFEIPKSKEKTEGRIYIEKNGYDKKDKDRIVSISDGKIEQFVLKPLN